MLFNIAVRDAVKLFTTNTFLHSKPQYETVVGTIQAICIILQEPLGISYFPPCDLASVNWINDLSLQLHPIHSQSQFSGPPRSQRTVTTA